MKDKNIYKRALQSAWPSVLESFFIALAAMIDTIMVSSLGSYAVAAVGLTNQPKFIAFAIFFSINTAVSALVARRKGQNDKRGANTVFSSAFVASIVLCILTTAFFLYFSSDIMRLAGSNKDTHEAAVKYFNIIIGGLIFNIIAMVINAGQRGSGNTKIAFTTNLTSSIVNVIFNYLLIGGNLGFPALGIEGAAIATVLGSAVAATMSVFSLFHKFTFIDIKYIFRKKISPKFDAIKSIFNLSSSFFIENIAMRVGFLATAISAANLGTDPFAAHNVGMSLLSIGFSFGDGMQVAAVALSGRALGMGEKEEAYNYGKVSQRIGLGISIALSLILLIFGRAILGNFFKEEHIIEMGLLINRFIMLILLLQISQIIYGGCLRAGGDVKFTLLVAIIAVTIIRTSVTLLFTMVFKLGLVGIWLGVLADQFSRFVLLRHRFHKKKWLDIAI